VLFNLETGELRPLTSPQDPDIGDSLPAFSPDGKRVAFNRWLGLGAHEIFLIELDGSYLRPLTDDRQDNGGFAWSADGESIVLSSNRSGVFGLWRFPVGGGEPEWLGFEEAYTPHIAAHGGSLAFERRAVDVDLWEVPLDDGALAGLPAERWAGSTRYDIDPQISPDGASVAFVSRRSGSYELWVARADGGSPRQLTFFAQPAPAWDPSMQHPRWSPDGGSILFAARAAEHFDVFRVPAAGGEAELVATSPGDDISPVWLDGDRWVYFTSNRSGSWELLRVPARGGDVRPVPVVGLHPTLESDGNRGLFFVTEDFELWRWDAAEQAASRLAPAINPRSWGLGPGSIYYVSEGGLFRIDAHSGEVAGEPLEGMPTAAAGTVIAASGRAIARDGSRLLYSAIESVESDLMLLKGDF
jgi:dipeptidyl aminopeptidase/acylaminoacyl peptidase